MIYVFLQVSRVRARARHARYRVRECGRLGVYARA